MSENLAEVYEQSWGEFESLKHLYVGTGMFIAGTLAVVIAIILATSTNVIPNHSVSEHWELAGIIAGIGFPAVFSGVFIVLPSNTRRTVIALVGAAVVLAGVTGFTVVFPHQWHGDTPNYSIYVVGTYAIGAGALFYSMFSSIVDFKTRNDPGGTVTIKVTREGETEYIEVPRSELRNGGSGLGFIGQQPDGNVETQTNTPSTSTGDQVPADKSRSWPEQRN